MSSHTIVTYVVFENPMSLQNLHVSGRVDMRSSWSSRWAASQDCKVSRAAGMRQWPVFGDALACQVPDPHCNHPQTPVSQVLLPSACNRKIPCPVGRLDNLHTRVLRTADAHCCRLLDMVAVKYTIYKYTYSTIVVLHYCHIVHIVWMVCCRWVRHLPEAVKRAGAPSSQCCLFWTPSDAEVAEGNASHGLWKRSRNSALGRSIRLAIKVGPCKSHLYGASLMTLCMDQEGMGDYRFKGSLGV